VELGTGTRGSQIRERRDRTRHLLKEKEGNGGKKDIKMRSAADTFFEEKKKDETSPAYLSSESLKNGEEGE
jgi:hypothetical protein